MVEERDKVRKDEACAHPLLCSDEWEDPEGATVLGEYHKDDLSEDERRVEEDLEAFEEYWRRKHGISFMGEYHKQGAPYLEVSSGWDGHLRRSEIGGKATARTSGPETRDGRDIGLQGATGISITSTIPDHEGSRPRQNGVAPPVDQAPSPKDTDRRQPPGLTGILDLNALEVAAYWIFRLAFGREAHLPIKREGLMDLDVHVQGKDVVVSTNQIFVSFPELVIWHITYAHKGRPVVEIGRGVKDGMRVHRLNALRLLFEIWLRGRKGRRGKDAMAGSPAPVASSTAEAGDELDPRGKGDIT